jgi:hypothetical protein
LQYIALRRVFSFALFWCVVLLVFALLCTAVTCTALIYVAVFYINLLGVYLGVHRFDVFRFA